MIQNYIKTALRVLTANKVSTAINILGFAAGIAATMFIVLYVINELSTDKFNENYDRIYRVEYGDFFVSGTAQALILKEEFAEVEQAVRIDYRYDPLVGFKERTLRFEHFLYADSTLFDVFTFKFLRGDPETALVHPFSLVLTESEAEKIFGNNDPLGESLKLNNQHVYTITGVVKDFINTHLPVSAIGSFSSLPVIEEDENHDRHLFNYMNFITYVTLHNNADSRSLSEKFNILMDHRYPGSRMFDVKLRPLKEIYFNREVNDSPPTKHGSLPLLYALAAVATLIMVIALFNFVNLASANANTRAKEIGVRMVMGANMKNLVIQFLTESVIIVVLAFILALASVEILLPVFNNLLGTDLVLKPFSDFRLLPLILALILITGVISGFYPAAYFSSLKTGTLIKGNTVKGKKVIETRRVLIAIQFAISVALIASTIIVNRQVSYMRNKDPGFNRHNLVLVRLNRDLHNSKDAFVESLKSHPGIISVALSNNLPGYVTWFNTWLLDGENRPHNFLPVDPDYIPLMDINILSGRNFEWGRTADMERAYILNESAVSYFGFDDPAGKEFQVGGSEPVKIIGVVENFNFRSLHEPVEPLVLGWSPGNLWLANIRIDSEFQQNALNYIEEQWKTFSPETPFEYRFLEHELDKLYSSEIRLGRLISSFATLAIIIACMGLYGLSTLIALRKTKEIGIRKALGASTGKIAIFITWEFAKWILLSNLVAWPAAYIIMRSWLENFTYRTEPDITIFLLSGLLALVTAIMTVGSHAWKTANLNPADTLRDE